MKPTDEDELAEAIAGTSAALHIRGGGSRAGLGHSVTGAVLETGGLTGITLYEPGALTIVARAGTPMAEVEAALEAEKQMLPFEPMDHRALLGSDGAPTIGGVVAANVSGPRRIQAGACRDSLIGVRFVDGRGTAIKNGGRVMKNVTGYDLVKLMAGSHGTLGVLSEVSFKVLPAAEAIATVKVHGVSPSDGVTALSAAVGSPYDVTGAAVLPEGVALVRVEGFEGSVRYRAGQLKDMLGRYGEVTIEEDRAASAAIWADVRDAKAIAGLQGDVWRISVKPTHGAKVVEA
ncbi:MAG: FAD-binding protein, partial [Pseudomonadota bacterium]